MAFRIFRSTRLRLVVYHILVCALMQAIFGIAFLSYRHKKTSEQFDECLRGHAQSMVGVVTIAANYDVTWAEDRTIAQFARGFSCAEFYHHIRKPTGEVIDSSSNLSGRMLTAEIPPLEELKSQRSIIETVAGENAEAILGAGGRFRTLHHWHVTENGQPLIFQVAMSLNTLDSMNEQILMIYLALCTVGLIACGFTTWLITDRAMQPWKKMRSEVGKITPSDLGQRIEIEEVDSELTEVASTLNDLLDRIDRAFKAQNEFLSNAAHELRTPVSVLLGEAQIVRRKARTVEEYNEFMETIEDEMRRLSSIITGMLTLARTRAGTRALSSRKFSANDLVMEAMEECEALAAHRKVQFSADLALYGEDELEPNIRGDKRLLVAMLDNIIRNAIRVSPPGEKIYISVVVENSHVSISIEDRGPGIPEDKIDDIFKDFLSIRVRGAQNGGAGIGLAIARSVVELHGGEIIVSNGPEGGARFTVLFPHDLDDDEGVS